MGVPRVPLTELYSKAGEYILAKGGRIELRSAVDDVEPIAASCDTNAAMLASRSGVRLCVNGSPRMFDFAVLAVPFDRLARMLPQGAASEPLRAQLARFETSPITGVHLWFDREITYLEHAVLLDRTIQWMFNKTRIQDRRGTGNGQRESGAAYIELVISASKSLVETPRQEIIELAVRELAARVIREGLRAVNAAGIRLESLPEVSVTLFRTLGLLPTPLAGMLIASRARRIEGQWPLLGSTLQSLRRGQPTEIDYLNGEIVRLGTETGRPTPLNAKLAALVHDVERTGEYLTVDELCRQLDD
jgi:hypothetical protein